MSSSGLCEAILPGGAVVFFVLGVVSHLLYFIHGELNKQAGSIATSFLSAWSALVVLFAVFCRSMVNGVFVATTLVLSYQVGLGSSIATYRLAFHSVRKFPGPLLAALTKWDAAHIAGSSQRYHAYLLLLLRKHGDLVRTVWKRLELSILASRAVSKGHGTIWVALVSISIAQEIRSFMQNKEFYGSVALKKCLITSVENTTQDFISCHTIRKMKKGIDVVNEFELFAFKLTAIIIFSEDIDETAPLASEAEDVYATLRLSQRAIGTYGHVPWYYSIAKRFTWLVPDNDNFTKLAQQMVDWRRNKKPEVPDLFTYLLPTIDDPNSAGFPISWEARLAMVAGSRNVSSALLSTSFYLATNPRIMEQLQEEVDPLVFSGEFDPKKGYPILDSILFETFRMQPLVPNGGERVSPLEGLKIGEHFIPGNTVIKVPLYTIFRDSRYFERPEEWIPSRWTTDKSLVKDGSAFIPFSTGVYSCVGRPLGIVEIRNVVAQLVHAFNFKIAEDRSPKGFENSGQDHFGMVFEPGSLLLDFEHRSGRNN